MNRWIGVALSVAVLLGACPVVAQTGAVERFLVPVYFPGTQPGAYGSLWVSELRVLNRSATPAPIENALPGCPTNECPPFTYPPGAITTAVPVPDIVGYGIPAAVLFVRSEFVPAFSFGLFVRDLSRTAQRWGTWIPVVRESDGTRGAVDLVGIPVESRYRHMIRVYAFRPALGLSVRIRIFGVHANALSTPTTPDPLLTDTIVPLRVGTSSQPGYAELSNLSVGTSGYDELRAVIEPQGNFTIWALASITNNDTQEVTIVAPNGPRF